MTPMAKLLTHGPHLTRSAMAQTQDMNEARLVVHNVMTHAFSRIDERGFDADAIMTCALGKHTGAA